MQDSEAAAFKNAHENPLGLKDFLIQQMSANGIDECDWRYDNLSFAIENANALLPIKAHLQVVDDDSFPLVVSDTSVITQDNYIVYKTIYIITLINELVKKTTACK